MALTGQTAEAIEQIGPAMQAIRKAWQPGNAHLYYAVISCARIFNDSGYFREAEPYARESLALVEGRT
jgi:hypothetical protein